MNLQRINAAASVSGINNVTEPPRKFTAADVPGTYGFKPASERNVIAILTLKPDGVARIVDPNGKIPPVNGTWKVDGETLNMNFLASSPDGSVTVTVRVLFDFSAATLAQVERTGLRGQQWVSGNQEDDCLIIKAS